MAASGPPAAFGKAAMAALRLSEGKQGASVPREYSKLRGHSVLLGVYEELKARHGSPEHAHERMASELGCKARSVEARVTQARNALGVLLGNSLHGFSELDARGLRGFSEEQLLRLLKAMPYNAWKGQPPPRRPARSTAATRTRRRRSGKNA
jgi:hypothetical protein